MGRQRREAGGRICTYTVRESILATKRRNKKLTIARVQLADLNWMERIPI